MKVLGHLDPDVTAKIEGSLFGNLKPMIDPWMRGGHTAEDIVKRLGADTRLSYKMLYQELIKSCESMQFISADTEELVQRLREKGTKVFVATDNMDSFTRWTAPSMNLQNIFDGVLNSYEIKAVKRDFDENGVSLFFNKFLRENGISYGESIIIDDGEDRNGNIQRSGIVYKRVKHGEGISKELLDLI